MAATSSLSAFTQRLKGKVAVITGAASGIGKSTAELFVQQGAKVVMADIQDELGHSAAQSISPSDCMYVHCDVTDEAQVKNAVDTAVNKYGKLDIMMNNAGICDPVRPRIIDNSKADFERVLKVNVTGVFLGIKHASQAMIGGRSGSIISTASIVSKVGGSATHAYCCAKHAVVGLTRNAAVELGQFGIRVNCLSPFGVATPLGTAISGSTDEEFEHGTNFLATLKGVTLKAHDVANVALFLATDDSRYVSGHNLLVDGGYTITASSPVNMFQYPNSS